MLARLHAHLRRLKPDAVLSFQHYGNLIGAPTARLAGVRYVVANRNSARLQMPGWVRLAETVFGTVGIFSAMVVNSGSVEDEYGKHPARFRRRLVRIEHGFESKVSGATRAEARAGLGLPAGATVLGSVARLHPLKNLASAVRLLPFDAGWHLAVAGQGPERSALEALARELGCDDRLHLVGELKPEAIGTFLAALDIFVFPSVAETFGLAVVEAAGAGVPVVANRLEVLQEVLRSEGEPCALFVDANDAAAFADAVRLLVSDRELAARLTRRGRQLGSRYSLDAMVEAYATLIAAHAGKRSGAARPAA